MEKKSNEDQTPHGKATGMPIALLAGVYGPKARVVLAGAKTSGFYRHRSIDVGSGVIVNTEGRFGAVSFNHAAIDFQGFCCPEDGASELILEKYGKVMKVDILPEPARVDRGFGSTGIKRLKLDNEIPTDENDSA